MNTEIDLLKLLADGYTFLKKKKWIIVSFFFVGIFYGLIAFFANPLKSKFFFKKIL